MCAGSIWCSVVFISLSLSRFALTRIHLWTAPRIRFGRTFAREFWASEVCVCVYVDGRVLEPSPMISSTCFARARTRPAIFMCERLTASQPPRWCELRFDNHHGFINILVAYCMRLGPSSIEHGTPEITNAPNDLRLCLALHFGGRTRYEVSDSYACAGINERSGPGIGRQ